MHHEHQIILQAAMEENAATSTGSPHTPSTTATTRGIPPPKSHSQGQATMVSTPLPRVVVPFRPWR
jgi:hypothetical protein